MSFKKRITAKDNETDFPHISQMERSKVAQGRTLQGTMVLWFPRILILQNDVRRGDRHYPSLPDKLSPRVEQHAE